MDVVETLHEYQHIFKRLNKLNKSLLNIAKENFQLKEANRKLREINSTYESRLAASERVFKSLQEKFDGQSSPVHI